MKEGMKEGVKEGVERTLALGVHDLLTYLASLWDLDESTHNSIPLRPM